MAAIFSLPAELLTPILELLSSPSLSKLSRTCKTFYTLLTSALYRSISWYWTDYGPSPPFHLLFRTFLANPKLADMVTSIEPKVEVYAKSKNVNTARYEVTRGTTVLTKTIGGTSTRRGVSGPTIRNT
jgi:hypothetical protein